MIEKSKWLKLKPYTKYQAVDPDGGKVRIAIYGKDYDFGFVYKKGSSRYGRIIDSETMMKNFTITELDPNEAWHKRLSRAIKALQKSGLWKELLALFLDLQGMTYEDKELMTQVYWSLSDIRYNKDMSVEDFNEEFSKRFAYYMEKYPFVFKKDESGKYFLDVNYIFELSDCKLKSMYFGLRNKKTKEEIRNSIEEKTDYHLPYPIRTSYDVRFNYKADEDKAWYSEEYKGCGNGHYYLALNDSLAIFCEND